ncbi:MAG: flagellar assembly protein FliH [Gammaproteobacteria bacterium]
MSKIIRSEELSECLSWQLPDMGGGASNAREQSSEQQLLTAAGIEEIQENARKEGFQQGLREGKAAGLQEMEEKSEQFDCLIHALGEPFERLDASIEQQLVQLAMCVARQLVRRELKVEENQVIAVVKDALNALPVASRQIQLVLHPDDASLVRTALSLDGEKDNLHIIEDPVLTRGGCNVVTDTSQIDMTVESRLNAIISNVLGGERTSDASA